MGGSLLGMLQVAGSKIYLSKRTSHTALLKEYSIGHWRVSAPSCNWQVVVTFIWQISNGHIKTWFFLLKGHHNSVHIAISSWAVCLGTYPRLRSLKQWLHKLPVCAPRVSVPFNLYSCLQTRASSDWFWRYLIQEFFDLHH